MSVVAWMVWTTRETGMRLPVMIFSCSAKASGSTETEESGFSRAFRFDKLNHHKEMAGGSGRYSGIGMSESIH